MDANERGVNESDLRYISDCLGRSPKGIVGVAARDKDGRPSVIANVPLIRTGDTCQPFPTLYWLVDPALSTAVADIERKGGVRAIEAALQEDLAMLAQHIEDNQRYAAERWALLNNEDQQQAEENGLVKVLRDSGIGGVANHHAIKCLHAQMAYHLASDDGTAVGRTLEVGYSITLKY